MVRAIALVLMQGLLISLVSPGCFAGEQGAPQQAAPKPPSQIPEARSRSLRLDDGVHPAPSAAQSPVTPVPSRGGDGGRPDITVGGTPGHSAEGAGKQP